MKSRCCASTLTYQVSRAIEEGRDAEGVKSDILAEEGNKLQLKHSPDLLIIPTITDVSEVIRRLEERKGRRKDDKSIFDTLQFQTRLKPLYEEPWLKELFKKNGTRVAYLDAGRGEQNTREQTIEIYKHYLETGEVHPNHLKP